VPPSSIRAAKRVPQRTNLGDVLGFAGNGFCEPVLKARSSAMRGKATWRRGVGVGSAGARMRRDGRGAAWLETLVDFGLGADGHGCGRRGMATAPFSMTRCCAVFGDDVAGAPDPVGGFAGEREDERGKSYRYETSKGFGKDLSNDRFRFGRAGSPATISMSPQNSPEDLAAGAAGRCERVGVGGHRHAAEFADAFGNGF